MRSRNVIIMLAIAAVLLVLLIVTREPARKRDEENQPKREALFPEVREDQVASISIETLGTSFTLTRQGQDWFTDPVRGHRADTDAVRAVFDALQDIPPAKLVSNTSDMNQWLAFKVHPMVGKRLRMTGLNGQQLFDLTIGGNPKMEFDSTYVRPTDSNETYVVVSRLGQVLSPPSWRNRVMLKADPADFSRVTIQTTTDTIVLAKAPPAAPDTEGAAPGFTPPPQWRMEQPLAGDLEPAVNSRLNSLMRFFTAAAPEDNDAGLPLSNFELDPPFASITFDRAAGGQPVVIAIGKTNPGGTHRYAKKSDDEQIFLLTQDACSFFLNQPSLYLGEAPPETEAPETGGGAGTTEEWDEPTTR